jgi:hypothetical protein
MKYLFVIYTDKKYKDYLDGFKQQDFYNKICEDANIEVIEWGSDMDTPYTELPTKTQQMMKWCNENKEYDYLVKCDDTIFAKKWIHYLDKLDYINIFKNNIIEHRWDWNDRKWYKIKPISNEYRGINLLKLKTQDWMNYKNSHPTIKEFDISKIKDISFFEGKFYMVSKEFSKYIGEQSGFYMHGIEDYMIGEYYETFKSIRSINR